MCACPPPERASTAGALVESDRRYFELGAVTEELLGASLARMPGLEQVPASWVVQRVRPDLIEGGGPDWATDVERRAAAAGVSHARIYLDGPAPLLEDALDRLGYRRRTEVAYVAARGLAWRRDGLRLRRVVSEADWVAKGALHHACGRGPDGYRVAAEAWVELERRKCRAGGMRTFLVEMDGQVRGAVSALDVDGLVRAKNVVVHPDVRRLGVGAQVLHLLWAEARAQGLALGVFGVPGHAGDALYRRVGMEPLTTQTEWSKALREPTASGKGR